MSFATMTDDARWAAVIRRDKAFDGRFITGVKAVIPGIAGMMGMPYRYFTLINVVSAFVWAAVHILPGMLLTASPGLSGMRPSGSSTVSNQHDVYLAISLTPTAVGSKSWALSTNLDYL